jgi:hypothetical protein
MNRSDTRVICYLRSGEMRKCQAEKCPLLHLHCRAFVIPYCAGCSLLLLDCLMHLAQASMLRMAHHRFECAAEQVHARPSRCMQ